MEPTSSAASLTRRFCATPREFALPRAHPGRQRRGHRRGILGSKNGTFVKGERITSARLSHGDEIRLGTVSLTFLVTPPAGFDDTV